MCAAILAAFPCFIAGCASAPSQPPIAASGDYQATIDFLSGWIPEQMRSHQVQGLSIAVVDDQKLVWARGFGYADVKHKVPALPETLYRIGSITKVITAVTVFKLAEDGRIDPDQPLVSLVPEFAVRSRFEHAKPVTPRALLAHHGGMPSDYLRGMWVDRPDSLAELVQDLHEESLASPPETLYKYSNIGYSLLGRAIERVSGESFAAAVRRLLLQPAGMTQTVFALNPLTRPCASKGYRNGQEAHSPNLRDAPAGGLYSTVLDLVRFLSVLFADGRVGGCQVLKPGTVSSLFTPQYPGLAFDFGHQVSPAWMLKGLEVSAGETVAWHNGGAPPFQAHVSLLPARKLGVVVLANSDEAAQIVTEIGVKALQLALKGKTGRDAVTPPPTPQVPTVLSAEKLAEYAGRYVVFGQMTPVRRQGSKLKIFLWGNTFDLIPIGADQFKIQLPLLFGLFSYVLPGMSLQFMTVENIPMAFLQGLPGPMPFVRVRPEPIPAAWRARLGEYQCDTSREEFEFRQMALEVKDGILTANLVLASKVEKGRVTETRIALKPLSDTEAVISGLGNGEGGTLRVLDTAGGGVLLYSGFRFIRKR